MGTALFAVVPGVHAFASPCGRFGGGGGSGGLLFLAVAAGRVRPAPSGALAFASAARDCGLEETGLDPELSSESRVSDDVVLQYSASAETSDIATATFRGLGDYPRRDCKLVKSNLSPDGDELIID